jgi:methylmalonyl-CoA mutase
MPTHTESLILKSEIALPKYKAGEIFYAGVYRKMFLEYPFTAGLYPLKRREDPSRMFAGEGGPERTNKRFHYVAGLPAKRLSTAFDSVTLYGNDPHIVLIFMEK